jgi:Transposase zinc-binding domain
MIRPPLEVADLVRTAGTAFLERNRQWIRWPHIKVLLAIARCRTAALGGHIDQCSRCGHRATISYNSWASAMERRASDGLPMRRVLLMECSWAMVLAHQGTYPKVRWQCTVRSSVLELEAELG